MDFRSAAELDFAPVRVTCEVNRPELIHCVVRPQFDPPLSRDGNDLLSYHSAEFGYELDEYQMLAQEALLQQESVIVSAPTSSGKTTVAVAALEIALQRENARAVFCAPIKALSNQMFSEFHRRFPGKVGLMTGDHSIAPDSPILVATTEIVRCLLHVDADFAVRLHTIIFDEVHYLSDTERGGAWEESIVLLAPGVSIVCLSATMANPVFLAGWLCQVKGRPVHSVQKRGRPVPLRHFAFPIGSDPSDESSLIEVRDASGKVDCSAIDKAARAVKAWHRKFQEEGRRGIQAAERGEPDRARGPGGSLKPSPAQALDEERPRSLRNLLTELVRQGRCPVLVFCFRKKDCDSMAKPLLSSGKLAEISAERAPGRAALVRKLIKEELHWIPEEDRQCEQLRWVTEQLLPHGIGVHHGGVVPLAREITEVLFKKGMLDVLFCTETFGMGLNMPARVVTFHFRPRQPLSKFDGKGQRTLTPIEYQQMSGRAGRRQLDAHGTSIITLDDGFEAAKLEAMLSRPSPPVCSHYEMQTSSALRLLQHGQSYVRWFATQTLLQFEERRKEGFVLEGPLKALMCTMQDPEIGLLDDVTGRPTDLGRACAACESCDAMLMGRLLSQGCMQQADPLDVAAYLTALVLERGRPDELEGADGYSPEEQGLLSLQRACQQEAAAVDSALQRSGLIRKKEDDGSVEQQLKEKSYLARTFRATWLNNASLDETAGAVGLDAGSLARLVRRMDECGRQLAVAMRVLGCSDAAAGLEEVLKERLRRGAPFCESLYFPKELRDRSEEVLDGLMVGDKRSGDPWACPHQPGSVVLLDPREVGFSHNSIGRCFGSGPHELDRRPLRTVAWELRRGERSIDDLCEGLQVVFYNGLPFTLGNRRLAVLRILAMLRQLDEDSGQQEPLQARFIIASREEALAWGWEGKFTTGTFRGVRTIIRETGEVLGQTLQDSLVSLEEDGDDSWYMEQQGMAGKFWDQYDMLPQNIREPEEEPEVVEEPRSRPEQRKLPICYECNEEGHVVKFCPYLNRAPKGRGKGRGRGEGRGRGDGRGQDDGRGRSGGRGRGEPTTLSLASFLPPSPPSATEDAFPALGGAAPGAQPSSKRGGPQARQSLRAPALPEAAPVAEVRSESHVMLPISSPGLSAQQAEQGRRVLGPSETGPVAAIRPEAKGMLPMSSSGLRAPNGSGLHAAKGNPPPCLEAEEELAALGVAPRQRRRDACSEGGPGDQVEGVALQQKGGFFGGDDCWGKGWGKSKGKGKYQEKGKDSGEWRDRGRQRRAERADEQPNVAEITLLEQTISFCKGFVAGKDKDKELEEKEEKREAELANMEGLVVLKKKEKDEAGPIKGKKSKASKAKSKTIKHNAETFQLFAQLKLDPPITLDDIPPTLEKLESQLDMYKEKVREWERRREEQKAQQLAAEQAAAEQLAAEQPLEEAEDGQQPDPAENQEQLEDADDDGEAADASAPQGEEPEEK